MAALAAHPSLKHVVVVDEDVDIFDPQDIEYAIATRVKGDDDIIMAALAAHPSLKHVVVVDEDVDIFDPQDIEYAIATRVKGDDDIIIVPKARGSSLDPKASEIDTKSILTPEKFERVSLSE